MLAGWWGKRGLCEEIRLPGWFGCDGDDGGGAGGRGPDAGYAADAWRAAEFSDSTAGCESDADAKPDPSTVARERWEQPAPGAVSGYGSRWWFSWGVVCAGDAAKHASISNNGVFLSLTNELGSTSVGDMQGPNRIEAQEWQFVVGTLSNDGQQINWSNGTFWARCPSGGGGSSNLNGNWYPNGNRSLQCSIQQHRGNLTLQNETGQRATGSIKGKRQVTTNWSGTKITGTVSPDGNRIDWSNGTYWIRYKVY